MPATLGCISWADDCLRAATAPSLPDVVDKVQKVLQVNLELAASLGITFSCSPTKTCLLLPPVRSPVAHLASDMPTAAAPAWVLVENRVLNEVVTVLLVDAYKHLGCVLVADGSPRPEIHFRLSQALTVSRPLAFKFFSNSRYPLAVRRCMLRSLVISKYVHGSVALCLEVGAHHRQWCAAYVSLWRTLCRRDPTTKKLLHAFEVLAVARAASPDLALACARAVFLQKHAVHGPATLLVYLQSHWELAGSRAWLSQLQRDVQAVCEYVPAARVLLDVPCPVRALFDSFVDEPKWWVHCVRQACKRYVADLELWLLRIVAPPSPSPEPCIDLPFVCPLCDAAFRLRRYLCSHLAKRHHHYSPVRHFAPTSHCLACLRCYGSVHALQNDLRRADACLLRLVHSFPPMKVEKLREAELTGDSGRRHVAKGKWQSYRKTGPILRLFGPTLPVFEERFPPDAEDMPLEAFCRYYRPTVQTLRWVDVYLHERSTMGDQPEVRSFWSGRPSSSTQRPTKFAQVLFHRSSTSFGAQPNKGS